MSRNVFNSNESSLSGDKFLFFFLSEILKKEEEKSQKYYRARFRSFYIQLNKNKINENGWAEL